MVRAYPEIYSEAEQFLDDLSVFLPYYEEMRELFAGKFCIIGNTGSGTTDLGSTPFQNSYPNVGTHANVYNTIMTQEFVTPVNWFVSAFFAAVLSFIAFGFHSKRKVLVQSLFGVGVLVIVVSIPVLLMRLFRVYVPIASPVLISVLSFFLVTFFPFLFNSCLISLNICWKSVPEWLDILRHRLRMLQILRHRRRPRREQ